MMISSPRHSTKLAKTEVELHINSVQTMGDLSSKAMGFWASSLKFSVSTDIFQWQSQSNSGERANEERRGFALGSCVMGNSG